MGCRLHGIPQHLLPGRLLYLLFLLTKRQVGLLAFMQTEPLVTGPPVQEECQATCVSLPGCRGFTYLFEDSLAHGNYCETFAIISPPSSCFHCTSGPRSCTCSGQSGTTEPFY
jgi:hypothetical protein